MVDVGESELGVLGRIRVPALEPEFPQNSCDDNQDEQQTTQYKGFHRGQIWIWRCSNKLSTIGEYSDSDKDTRVSKTYLD